MDRMEIREFVTQRIVGYIDTAPNGDRTVRDFYGKILGYYTKQNNYTKDFYGHIICTGDATAAFLRDMLKM